MTIDKFIKIAILFIISAVALGALGAHTLKDVLTENEIHSFEIGVRYQLFHGIGLLFLSLNSDKFDNKLKRSLMVMIIGVCCFSFSLYLLSIRNILELSLSCIGPFTPIGGILLISSWIILFFSIKKQG